MKTALVTGGNGFVGSILVTHLLRAGYVVHAIANRNRDVLDLLLPDSNVHLLAEEASSTAADLVAALQPNAIFHLAAHSSEPKTLEQMTGMLDGNLTLGTGLLHGATLCRKPPVFLNAGTFWQFSGPDLTTPNTFYAATKQAFHDILLYFRAAFELPAATLVLFDTIGQGDTRPKLWNKLAEAPPGSTFALSGGAQQIELIHVDDTARAFLHAAKLLSKDPQHLPGSLYGLRSNQIRTLRQLIESVQQAGNLNLHLDWGALPYAPGQIFHLWGGPQLPGWSPTTDVSETIAEMVRNHHSPTEVSSLRGAQ